VRDDERQGLRPDAAHVDEVDAEPPTVARNCGNAFRRASAARQS
jgi:hypothetical protein